MFVSEIIDNMTLVRVPLANPINSRTASLTKDSYSKNCYFEHVDGHLDIIKRPGTTLVNITGTAPAAGAPQGLFTFGDKLFAVSNNLMYKIENDFGSSLVTGSMSAYVAGIYDLVSFNQTSTVPYMTVHNQNKLYTYKLATNTLSEATNFTTIQTALAGMTPPLPYRLVPGIVYLDGYTFVMTTGGRIYASSIEDPTAWNALDFITAEAEPDSGVGIVKHFNYLVAFGTWSTEFFADAGSNTFTPGAGSPLLRQDSYRMEIGCADGGSIVKLEQSIMWVGKSKTHGKSVYILNGVSPIKVSTPAIERYLNSDQVTDIRAYTFKIEGHTFYVMTLHAIDLTFVYDVDEKMWYNWSFATVIPDGGTAIAGEAIAGVAVAGNTGFVPGSITEHYFHPTFFSEFHSGYYAMDDDSGAIYQLSPTVYNDSGNSIYWTTVTPLMDSGTTKRKFFRAIEVVGDKVTGTMDVRFSDDDYNSWSTYRSVDLSADRSKLYQMGSSRRRAWQFYCTDNVPIRIQAAEISFDIGGMEVQQA